MSDSWYPWFPGDYNRDTGHLSLAEDGAYRRLLDHYYATSKPLPHDHDQLCRIARAITEAERKIVARVACGFFIRKGDNLHNQRADEEIGKRRDRHERLSEAGKRGVEIREAMRHPGDDARHDATHDTTFKQATTTTTTISRDTARDNKEVAGSASPKRSAKPADTVFLESLRPGCVADGIDLDAQIRKMQRWLLGPKGKGRKLTQGFVINWLNKCDKEVNAPLIPSHKLTGYEEEGKR